MNEQLLDSVAQLEVAKQKIEGQNTELKYLADHDQLTSALTRRAFLERSQQLFLKAAARRDDVTCVMVDIDHFKSINDRYGHLVGDQVIHRVALTAAQRRARGRAGVPLRGRGVLRAGGEASKARRRTRLPMDCAR